MSKTLSDETITCVSCEYRYPPREGICPMCGTEPLGQLWDVPNRFNRVGHTVGRSSSDSRPRTPNPTVRRLIPVVMVVVALMAVTAFLYTSHNHSTPKGSGAAAKTVAAPEKVKLETADRHISPDPVKEVQQVIDGKLGTTALAATSEQTKVENAAERDVVHDLVGGTHPAAAGKPGPVQEAKAAKENDPVELWKAVKRGSVNAEVALANLYLEGRAVPQSCEQAHMLLSAASIKGSKAADDDLKGSYAERCE